MTAEQIPSVFVPVLVPMPDLVSYAALATEIETAMKSLTITSEVERGVAAEWLARAKEAVKTLHTKRREALKPLESDRDIINATFAAVSGPIERAEADLGKRIGAWTLAEQQRIRRENEEAERKRKAAAAEAERLAAQARRLAEEAERAKAVVAAPAQAETLEEFLLTTDAAEAAQPTVAQAVEAANEARREAGVAALQAVPQPMQAEPTRTVETSRGTIGTRQDWTWELLPGGEALVPREFLSLDQGKITRAVKGGRREIPGIRIYPKATVALRPGS